MPASLAKVGNPNRSIDKDHIWPYAGLRLGMGRRFFSVPPSLASLLLLSRAIKASKPSRTKDVFSLTPVSRDAFSKILSSMLSVVLICICMPILYIQVKRNTDFEGIAKVYITGSLRGPNFPG